MNRGMMLKAAYETWPPTLLCGVLLFGVEAILAYVMPTFQAQFSEALMQIRFIQTFVGAMLGVNASEPLGQEAFTAFPWVHPVVLALVWAHALVSCTRMPAGEVDRGTVDLTLTLPLTRWGILRAETVVWLGAGLIVVVLGLAGNEAGGRYADAAGRPELSRSLVVAANLMCLYLAVGGLSWLVSAASSRRGGAIIVVFLILLASFLLNFLAQFWTVAQRIRFLGVLDYYRPLYILRDGTVPWRDLGILLSVAAVLWIAAGIVFSRRDVCTV
ncbi:MAG: ABC transporter permease subunit [Pirellulales bacterium]